MSIEGMITPIERTIGSIQPLATKAAEPETAANGMDFAQMLKTQLDEMVELHNTSEEVQQGFLAGEVTDISEVVLAIQQADIALNLAIELRNKVIEAYTEISRTQI